MAIVGNLYKLEKHFSQPTLGLVFTYLKKALDESSDVSKHLHALPLGTFEKHTLEDGVFAFLQVAHTQNIETCFIESHKKYVDFQLLVAGSEEMGYIDVDKLEVDVPYDEAKDLITYAMQENFSKFVLEAQDMAVFFPEDGHIGLAQYKTKSLIRKVVVKVPVKLLTDT